MGCDRGPITYRSGFVVPAAWQCRELLRCDWCNKAFAQYVDRPTLLEARAGSNQRLVKTFGIDNAFTTIHSEYHKIFMNRVAAQLNTTEWEYAAISTPTTGFVRDGLAQGAWRLVS
jgi:hypothetical protein